MISKLFLAGLAVLGASLASAQTAGYEAPWDLKRLTQTLTAQVQRLQPVLAQSDPARWSDADAAAAYKAQWNTVRNNIDYFSGAAAKLAAQPEKVSVALETYFRMEALDRSLASFLEGVRKYYSPDGARILQNAMNENYINREQLKQYMTDLAAAREQEFQIADREAQRCRGDLARQPSPAPASRRR